MYEPSEKRGARQVRPSYGNFGFASEKRQNGGRHAAGFARRGVASRQGEGLQVPEPRPAPGRHAQKFAAPDRLVVAQARAVECEPDALRRARFRHHGRDVRGVVLNEKVRNPVALRARFGERRRRKVRMRVGRVEKGRDFVETREVVDRILERPARARP